MADNKAGRDADEPQPTSADLFSSAKLVAAAAQTCFQGGADKVEKEKVAGAAADLLGAASRYGKLEEKGYGQYVEKAETYLEQYSSGGSAPVSAEPAAVPVPAAAEPAPAPEADEPAPAKAESETKSEGGGAGEDLFKAAKGFLGSFPAADEPAPAKAESEAKSEGGGAGEDLFKAAKGFLGSFPAADEPAPAKAESEAKSEGGGAGEGLFKAAKGFLGGL